MGKKTKKETVGAGIRKVTRRDFIRTAAGLTAGIASGVYKFSDGIPPAFAQKKTRLTYWARDYSEQDAKKLVTEFMRLHPEYDITVEAIPMNGLYEKINTALIGGKAADIISCSLNWVAAFAELGFLHPMDKVWEKDVSKGDREDYFPSGISYCTYKGKLYGAPWRVDGNILVYSVDALKEAGLNPAKAPDTWDDVLQYAKKLTIASPGGATKQYGLTMQGKPVTQIFAWFLTPLVWSFGGDFTDEKCTKSRMNEKPVIEAYKYAAELNTKYKVATPAVFSYTYADISPVLAKRNAAIMFGHQANIGIIWKVTPGMKLATAPYPKGPAGRYSRASGWCHIIPVSAKLEDAWPFLLYLQDPMRQAVLTVGTPGRKAGLAHEKYDVYKKDPLLKEAVMSGADTAIVGPLEKSPLGPKIYDELGRIFSEAWEGKITPEDAALKSHGRVNAILKG
jgi:multiple sugar transport system substrate-binding protein